MSKTAPRISTDHSVDGPDFVHACCLSRMLLTRFSFLSKRGGNFTLGHRSRCLHLATHQTLVGLCVCVCMHCVRIALCLELLCLGRSPIVRIDVYMISIFCHPSLAVQLVYFLTDICVASMESRLGPYACLPHSRRFASQAWSLMPHVAGSVSTSHVSAKSWN